MSCSPAAADTWGPPAGARTADQRAVDDALERVERTDYQHRQIGALSGGQRKRPFLVLNLLWTAAERYTHLVLDPTSIDEKKRRRRYDSHAALLQCALDRDSEQMLELLTAHFTFNEGEIRRRIDALHKAMAR